MTKAEPPKKGDHDLHKFLPHETGDRQPPSQRRYGRGNERCISRALSFIPGEKAVEFEVLEVWEDTNEIHDLSVRAVGVFESKESECR